MNQGTAAEHPQIVLIHNVNFSMTGPNRLNHFEGMKAVELTTSGHAPGTDSGMPRFQSASIPHNFALNNVEDESSVMGSGFAHPRRSLTYYSRSSQDEGFKTPPEHAFETPFKSPPAHAFEAPAPWAPATEAKELSNKLRLVQLELDYVR
jgi:hypothetical protein